ncbi:hypothetical protein OF829_07810 [Sphingomonas sp. LB-2]|uniref:hypothetical protein n=1 Tax=Sphingomonas caeni TaxID=2984949 RepID=UPI00222E7485|nr:hypothetical protein [Sphingomonas caeni]MCW3847142.1 hypothetical protein [Sphingomonas caeni]
MADINTPLMVLLLGVAQFGRLVGHAPLRPSMKWALMAVNLAVVLLALAYLFGFRLRAPVPGFVPVVMVLAGLAMLGAALYRQARTPAAGS